MADPKSKQRISATEADKARAAHLAVQVELARAKAMKKTASAYRAIGDDLIKSAAALHSRQKHAAASKPTTTPAGRVKIIPSI